MTITWADVRQAIAERIGELTATCTSKDASDLEIRQAQAGIAELHRLTTLPNRMQASVQQRANASKRTEY